MLGLSSPLVGRSPRPVQGVPEVSPIFDWNGVSVVSPGPPPLLTLFPWDLHQSSTDRKVECLLL